MKPCQSQDDGYGIESTKAIMDCEWIKRMVSSTGCGPKKMEMICHGGWLVLVFDKRNTFSAVCLVNNAYFTFWFLVGNHVSKPFAGTCGELFKLERLGIQRLVAF
jgi:hypothetical protein